MSRRLGKEGETPDWLIALVLVLIGMMFGMLISGGLAWVILPKFSPLP